MIAVTQEHILGVFSESAKYFYVFWDDHDILQRFQSLWLAIAPIIKNKDMNVWDLQRNYSIVKCSESIRPFTSPIRKDFKQSKNISKLYISYYFI